METNQTPVYDTSDNPTECCPRFLPESWDGQDLHFEEKPFVRVKTRSLMHIPLNMGSVFPKTFRAIEAAQAQDISQSLVLSRDLSPWSAEHYFAVTKDVPDHEMAYLSGDYRTGIYEGSFREMAKWGEAFEDKLEAQDKDVDEMYYFYTTCPKCAKAYGKNYVVGFAKLDTD